MAEKNERDFHHPYTPYPIQLEFMHAVYNAIENECIGIFESPTGLAPLLRYINLTLMMLSGTVVELIMYICTW